MNLGTDQQCNHCTRTNQWHWCTCRLMAAYGRISFWLLNEIFHEYVIYFSIYLYHSGVFFS
jgi:hypothetical protein